MQCLVFLVAFGWTDFAEAKVSAAIILTSVQGEVKALSLDEDFEIALDASTLGKTLDDNFIVATGKNGKAVFLFSNGVLATLKPNTRLYVRKFVQESFLSKGVPPPLELKEEPSNSHLKFHLDHGDLVVKAPKLSKGSTMNLTSPLGTARIRGTIFQLVVARDPETGTVSGGLNLISGDVDFTDVSGDTISMASGEGMEVFTSDLGDLAGNLAGELRDLTSKFGPVLAGTGPFPELEFPQEPPPEGLVLPEPPPPPLLGLPPVENWGAIHDVATDTFFAIEEAEETIRSITFEQIEDAVSVTTPTPALTGPVVPGAFTGEPMPPPDPFYGGHPDVRLKGSSVLEVEMGEPFIDPGVNVTDFSGADQSGTAKLINPPDTATPGTYTLTYTGNDFRGFESAVNRTVQVIVTPPVITLNPGTHARDSADGTVVYHSVSSRNPVSFPDSVAYVDPGYSALDYAGRDLSGFFSIEGPTPLNTEEIASYTFTYSVDDQNTRGTTFPDGAPVSTTVTRTVNVEDLTPPRIQVLGFESLDVEAATSYTDAGAEAIDNYDNGDALTALIQTSNNIDLLKVGTYSVLYEVTDSRGNVADVANRTVTVVDTTPPVIEFYGQQVDFIDLNSTYRDAGAFATDTLDGDLTEQIVITDPIPEAIANKEIGTYTVSYDVVDAEGNAAATVSRTIVVLGNDGKGPSIELLGDNPLYLEVGTGFVEPGAVAFKDMGDGRKIDYEVVNVSGTPNMNQLGTTVITYRAEDEFGNSLTTTRTVIIRDSTSPVIYPNKSNGQTDLFLEAGSSYTDDGATATDNYDGDLTSKITSVFREKDTPGTEFDATAIANLAIVGFVDPTKQYEVLYNATDESNNTGSSSRTLSIYDATPPTISFVLDPATGEISGLPASTYSSDGGKTITVIGDTTEILFDPSSIATVADSADEYQREIITQGAFAIADTRYPAWTDAGVVATDNAVGDLELIVPTPTAVATSEAGVSAQYRVTYQAKDASGNLSQVLERTIKVLEGPRVTLNGSAEIIVVGGYNETDSKTYSDGYDDAGATAEDALGNDLTNAAETNVGITVDYTKSIFNGTVLGAQETGSLGKLSDALASMKGGGIDLTKTGKYEIFYKATDSNLNQSPEPQVSRVVYSVANDIDNPGSTIALTPRDQPSLLLNGTFWEVTLEVNATGYGSYVDPGAVAHKTRHAGLGPPYEEKQTWDENNASSEGSVLVTGDVVPSKLSVVNKYGGNKTPAFSDPYVVKYSVTDEFDNPPAETQLRVYVVDKTTPVIVPNEYAPGFVNPTIEANATYNDSAFAASDNYWDVADLITQTTYYDKNKQEKTINEIKTWNLSDFSTFFVRYQVWDKSENYRDFNRTVTITDTISPVVSLLPNADTILLSQNPPETNSSYIEYGISVVDNSIDPDVPLTFTSSTVGPHSSGLSVTIDSTAVNIALPGEYTVTYTVADSSDNVTTITRTVTVLDKEKPLISASISSTTPGFAAAPGGPYFVVVEGGVQYDDDSGQTVKRWNGADYNSTSPIALTLTAADTQDGVITSSIARIINGNIVRNNDVGSVPALIDTSTLNAEHEIKYDINDTAGNAADSVYRRLIVKDTLPPSIQFSGSQTILVDYKSTTNPDVRSAQSVKDYMLLGLAATDANNFDQYLDHDDQFSPTGGGPAENKWKVVFEPEFVEGAIHPETRGGGQGYKVTISVRDYSGNESDEIIRYLQVGDFTPPVLTMMGKSEIHDFFRFGYNADANTSLTSFISPDKNVPFFDQPASATNPEQNATGLFSRGAHRMLPAEYKFTDPGVYAEDNNASWSIVDGYPDLDGDNIGEAYAITRVTERNKMDTCAGGAGIIHSYTAFAQTTVKELQSKMASNLVGYTTPSPAKVPDVDDSDNSRSGVNVPYDFNTTNKTDLINMEMTVITIEYRVKDGWDNLSQISTRKVYIYESQQFGNSAFYATPLTDANTFPFERFHKEVNGFVDENATPYMTSMRKDYDGDGVSDYWEAVLGTGINDKTSTPNLADPTVWDDKLKGKWNSGTWLLENINLLNDARLLRNQSWVNSGHILKDASLTNLP